jgi:2-oxo-4-hydroxy-4-carboxy-5-ureidoimidazoline decarboxylase
MTSLDQLNRSDQVSFVQICGPLFEHSPWIAEKTYSQKPFTSIEALHAALVQTMRSASTDEQVKLIAAHPDLVGRLAREGKLTRESTREQSAAGLAKLSPEEVAQFERFNAEYRNKFGFPFVICARENKKDAILAAFPVRLRNTRQQEIETALTEIAKIAKLRLIDAVSE